jgi:hypothetical protein
MARPPNWPTDRIIANATEAGRKEKGKGPMKKIISLFQRNYETDRLVRDEVVPGAEWVLAGEGIPTRKLDGTPCLVRDGRLYKRYDCKAGKRPPDGFEPCQEPDEVTGHWPGWVPVSDAPADQWFREAFAGGFDSCDHPFVSGRTYECCGPKIQGNPEKVGRHILIPHGVCNLDAEDGGPVPRTFAGIKAYLAARDIEGIVWWRDLSDFDFDCDKVKIKKKDFFGRRI